MWTRKMGWSALIRDKMCPSKDHNVGLPLDDAFDVLNQEFTMDEAFDHQVTGRDNPSRGGSITEEEEEADTDQDEDTVSKLGQALTIKGKMLFDQSDVKTSAAMIAQSAPIQMPLGSWQVQRRSSDHDTDSSDCSDNEDSNSCANCNNNNNNNNDYHDSSSGHHHRKKSLGGKGNRSKCPFSPIRGDGGEGDGQDKLTTGGITISVEERIRRKVYPRMARTCVNNSVTDGTEMFGGGISHYELNRKDLTFPLVS